MIEQIHSEALVHALTAPDQDAADFKARENDRRRILAWCLAHLTRRQCRAVRMRYEMDLTYREIGDALQISEPAAFALHARAIDHLRSTLARQRITSLRDI